MRAYGTDLGFSFSHRGKVQFLFGDTWVTPTENPFPNDDAQGAVSLAAFPGGGAVDAYLARHPATPGGLPWLRSGPPLTWATDLAAPTELSFIEVIRDGVSLSLGPANTPTAAFSAGDDAFGLFIRLNSQECRPPSPEAPQCDDGLTCDPGVGTCLIVPLGCVVKAVPGARGSCPFNLPCLPTANGICRDETSSIDDGGPEGRARSIAQIIEVGAATPGRLEHYNSRPWAVNKLMNPTVRTVRNFKGKSNGADYGPPRGKNDKDAKVFVWGRPAFAGSRAEGREAQLYFAVADVPTLDATGTPSWDPRYFAGLGRHGEPLFSPSQVDATPLDLNAGNGPHEVIDNVAQLSVSWVESLDRWVMLYGGDFNPVLYPVFGPGATRTPDGAILVRFAENPWGPWTPPTPVVRAGDPLNPNQPGSEYGPGGILFHPACAGGPCVASDPPTMPGGGGPGYLYGASIIDAWTEKLPRGETDLYWNVSTFNPYGVMLMKTRFAR